MEKEIWKDIPGYEGLYQASTLGRIKSLSREMWNGQGYFYSKEKILKAGLGGAKHAQRLMVVLSKDGKKCNLKVHTLIALTFLGERKNDLCICHNDGDPLNNKVENLRYDTLSQNTRDIYRQGNVMSINKLTPKQIVEIRKMRNEDVEINDIAKTFDVKRSVVRRLLEGKTYRWIDDEGNIL